MVVGFRAWIRFHKLYGIWSGPGQEPLDDFECTRETSSREALSASMW